MNLQPQLEPRTTNILHRLMDIVGPLGIAEALRSWLSTTANEEFYVDSHHHLAVQACVQEIGQSMGRMETALQICPFEDPILEFTNPNNPSKIHPNIEQLINESDLLLMMADDHEFR